MSPLWVEMGDPKVVMPVVFSVSFAGVSKYGYPTIIVSFPGILYGASIRINERITARINTGLVDYRMALSL